MKLVNIKKLWNFSMVRSLMLVPSILSITACDPSLTGKYEDPVKAEILDESWNETDARKTAEVLINSMLEKQWLPNFMQQHQGKRPIVIVKDVENRTTESSIDTKSLLEAIRDDVINSGKVRFIDGEGRKKILDEIDYQHQSGMVSESSAKRKGRQIGADFMISGALSSQEHRQDKIKTITYQTVLQMTDLETSEIVWSQKFDIKKRFKRSSVGW